MKQDDFVNTNIKKAYSIITHLKSLPLTDEQRHILYGFILKWHGSYPVQPTNTPQYAIVMELIGKEFFKFDGNTPEKIYCVKPEYLLEKSFVEPLPTNTFNETTLIGEINNDSSLRNSVEKILQPLSGSWKKGRKISSNEYENLVANVVYLIRCECMPTNVKQIGTTAFPVEFIRKTFHELFNNNYSKRSPKQRRLFVKFLHKTFLQFSETQESTTLDKFSQYQKTYKVDCEEIKYD